MIELAIVGSLQTTLESLANLLIDFGMLRPPQIGALFGEGGAVGIGAEPISEDGVDGFQAKVKMLVTIAYWPALRRIPWLD